MNKKTIEELIEEGVIPSFKGVRDAEDVQQRFVRAARQIIFGYELVSGECCWEISELELYLFTGSDVWRDDTTHQSTEQLRTGTWYVHQYENGNWIPPDRSGIDLTVGCEHENTYGGLLIRQICNKGGSGTAFKTILREPLKQEMSRTTWSEYEREQIAKIHGASVTSEPLTLRRREGRLTEPRLWIGHRKGLKGKKFEKALLRMSMQNGENII